MRKPSVALVLSLVIVVFAAAPGLARLERSEATSAALIEDAYSRGELNRDEMILQKAYALYAPWKLNEDFLGEQTEKCGAPIADELFRILPELPEALADEIRDLRARPVRQTYVETAHFRIHYDETGTHKIKDWPITTYRDAVMTAAENVYTAEITTMGFRVPPPDGSDPDGGGGNDLYDIYVQNLGPGLYGYCQPTYYYSGGGYPANAATSYIVIDNDYTGFSHTAVECAQITVAHEFNHGCQAAHDVNEPTWYKECTSTWIEDQIYDSVNDYISYLSSFMNSLYRSIDYHDGNFRWYGSCVWNFFLHQYYGGTIVQDIWYQCENSSGDPIDMMDVVLATYGSSIEEAYSQFAVWCYFTGSARNDGAHFEEGGDWPAASIMRGHNIYPIAIGGPTPGWEPDALGCNYIQFNYTGSGYNGLLVDYDGPSLASVPNFAFINYRDSGGHYHEYGEISLNPWGVGELTIEGWNNTQGAALVVANLCTSTNDMSYNYGAEEVDTGIEDAVYSFGMKSASPNPFAETTQISYSAPTGGGLLEITIYDVNGREVRTLMRDQVGPGSGVAVWDGLDNAGERVASGVYFARLDINGLTASGKLMMLK